MTLFKKAAIALAATSMIAAPVAASAAPALESISSTEGQNELEGSSWIIAIVALAAIIAGIVIASDNDDDTPTSP